MKIEACPVGPIQTNCYMVEDGGEVIVIDPGDELTRIVADLKARPVREIICTHRHWDHVSELAGLAEITGAPVAMSAVDAAQVDGAHDAEGHDIDRGHGAPHVARRLAEGDEVAVGDCVFKVIETPGHTEGSICLYCEAEGVLFTGDTVFSGGRFGRTDFEGGSMDAMVETLGTKFANIPDEVIVLPGHERSSTMGRERTLNPYLR